MRTKEKVKQAEPTAEDEELPSDPLDRAERYLELGKPNSAQNVLDSIKEDSGRKHYLQSKIYRLKCWYNEQRKQLKIAIKKEPHNEEYKKELKELMEFRKTAEYKRTVREPERGQMGNTDICTAGFGECCAEICCYCGVEGICECIGNG